MRRQAKGQIHERIAAVPNAWHPIYLAGGAEKNLVIDAGVSLLRPRYLELIENYLSSAGGDVQRATEEMAHTDFCYSNRASFSYKKGVAEMSRFIDLSVAIESGLPSDPPLMIPKIMYVDHALGAESMKAFYPGLTASDLPEGLGWAIEVMEVSTHAGTHMDAPWHYHPTQDGGNPALTIDQFPLEWGVGNGVKLDFSGFPDGYNLTVEDVQSKLNEIGHVLKPGDVFLAQSGAAPYWGTSEYLVRGCGFGRAATLWILEQGVHVVGTDGWSWDRPLPFQAEEFAQTKDASLIWEGHFAGIEKGYFQIEKLTNLDKLPSNGFRFYCFPVKIKGASAGWIRAVAEIV